MKENYKPWILIFPLLPSITMLNIIPSKNLKLRENKWKILSIGKIIPSIHDLLFKTFSVFYLTPPPYDRKQKYGWWYFILTMLYIPHSASAIAVTESIIQYIKYMHEVYRMASKLLFCTYNIISQEKKNSKYTSQEWCMKCENIHAYVLYWDYYRGMETSSSSSPFRFDEIFWKMLWFNIITYEFSYTTLEKNWLSLSGLFIQIWVL